MNSFSDFLDENRDEDKKENAIKLKLMFKFWCYTVCYATKYFLNNWYKISWWQS